MHNKRTFWYCGGKKDCGHVVGEIGHMDLQKGGSMKVLLLYEQSLDAPPDEVPPLRGRMPSVFDAQCTKCKNKFEWYLSLESLNKLMSHYQQPKEVANA